MQQWRAMCSGGDGDASGRNCEREGTEREQDNKGRTETVQRCNENEASRPVCMQQYSSSSISLIYFYVPGLY